MNRLSNVKLSLWLPDEAATVALGRSLVGWLPLTSVVYLLGDLGAGKTTLTRGILRALGHDGPVKSPTYTLLEPYTLDSNMGIDALWHFDLYRISDPAELEYIGIDEIMDSPGVKLIEWPARGGDRLPAPDLTVELTLESGGRRATIC